jgi:hypothetical protein
VILIYTYVCTFCNAGWTEEDEDFDTPNVRLPTCRWCGSNSHVQVRGMHGKAKLR